MNEQFVREMSLSKKLEKSHKAKKSGENRGGWSYILQGKTWPATSLLMCCRALF